MLKPNVHGAGALLLAVAMLAAGCGGAGEPQESGTVSSPPVVLITLDGFSADRLAVFGGEQPAPTIDRLVATGSAWTDAWTVCPMTRPAVATYLTGLAPDRHGVWDDLFTPLGENWPTLASVLSAKGYQTAAFPDSSFLGAASGVLRGFDVVDDPPSIPVGPDRWIPMIRDPAEVAEHFGLWIGDLPAGEGFFAWLHFSGMMREQFIARRGNAAVDGPVGDLLGKGQAGGKDDGATIPEGQAAPITVIDAAIGEIMAALELRGDAERAVIVIAGTSATLGAKSDAGGRGPGFSLEERAIRVPVIARFPAGMGEPRSGEQAVWAPDIPATIAQLTGAELSAEAEGVSLLAGTGSDRTLFAWSWATLDQMGWLPLRAVRREEWKRMEGWGTVTLRLDGGEAEADPGRSEALAEAIRSRGEPERSGFDPGVLDAWAVAHGLNLRPVPAGGRDLESADTRRQAARLLWRGRTQFTIRKLVKALAIYERVLEQDPQNLGALLDRGQILTLGQEEEDALPLLRKAVELYPNCTEAWHWLAHATWQSSSWEEAVPVLEAILPYQSNDADVLYDLACTNSLAGDLEESAVFLGRAIEAGFTRWDHIDTDADLRNLRASERYSDVLRKYGP